MFSFLLKAAYFSILCIYDILFIHLSISVYIWVVSAFWLLGIVVLLWTQVYKYLLEIQHSAHWSIYPEAKLLDLRLILFFIFWETTILFSIAAAPFYIPTGNAQVSYFFTSSSTLLWVPVFCKMLWETQSKLFGQPNTYFKER